MMQQNIAILVVQAEAHHISLIVPLFDAYRQFYHQPTDSKGVMSIHPIAILVIPCGPTLPKSSQFRRQHSKEVELLR
ncbi:MAG: hypothetical protein NVS4B7_19780 [Ktedonobacteraceae bacterium]